MEGREIYLETLKTEYEEGLKALSDRAKKASSPAESAEIEREITALRTLYQRRVAQSLDSLF